MQTSRAANQNSTVDKRAFTETLKYAKRNLIDCIQFLLKSYQLGGKEIVLVLILTTPLVLRTLDKELSLR